MVQSFQIIESDGARGNKKFFLNWSFMMETFDAHTKMVFAFQVHCQLLTSCVIAENSLSFPNVFHSLLSIFGVPCEL